jgi:gamma-glutamyltranspeptidase/glutathione hydrolase
MDAFITRPELCGTFGAVASSHWIGSAVGMRTLELGGNAFDAAVAVGFTLQVIEPQMNGPFGDVPILAARRGDGEPTVICGQGGAPAAATPEHFAALGLDMIPGTGLLAATVPGAFGAWLTLLRDWGTLPLRQVLAPAIAYARDGFPLPAKTAEWIEAVAGLFRGDWPTSAAIYLPGGEVPRPGVLFANPQMGRLYEQVLTHAESARGGREAEIEAALAYWYDGPIAETIDRFCAQNLFLDSSGARHGGLLRASDLRGWRPPVEKAVGLDFHGARIFKCGAWTQGPVLLQALRILEGEDLAALDPQGPEFVHLVAESLKLAMADRDVWYGDSSEVPLATLLSAAYGAQRRAEIARAASQSLCPGSPDGRAPIAPLSSGAPAAVASLGAGEPNAGTGRTESLLIGDTCHIDVVDRWGNMASATPSGGWLMGGPVIPDFGFPLGTRLQMSTLTPGLPNTLAPGRRPRTTLSPSMAFRDGAPYLAFGTPGGDQQDQWQLQFLLHHLVYGMSLQRAIEAPAFHIGHLIASFWPKSVELGALTVESRFPEATIEKLRAWGHAVKVGGPWSEGELCACARETQGGREFLRAAASPRTLQEYAIVR